MFFKIRPPLEIVDRFDRYQTVVFIHLFSNGRGLIESLSADEERLIKRPLYLIRYKEVNYRSLDRKGRDGIFAGGRSRDGN